MDIHCRQKTCGNCPGELRAACGRLLAEKAAPADLPAEIDRRDPELGAMVLTVLFELSRVRPGLPIGEAAEAFAESMPYSRHRYEEITVGKTGK